MGLDMYLYKKTYVGNDYEDDPKNQATVSGDRVKHVKQKRIVEVSEKVMYWRKANAIHAWFVKNVQGGEDDCKEYCFESDKLQELLDTITTVLEDHSRATNLLPTQTGFFFGNEEYDQYYLQNLEETQKELTALLAEPDADIATYCYQSSW